MKIPLALDNFDEEETEAVMSCLRSRTYTMGERVRTFENAFAEFVGAKHSIMVNSGSSANLLLVDSLIRRLDPQLAPLQKGDEVLVPALSWPTTVWPLVQLGLTPVFVDSDPSTLAIDLESAKSVLSPKTKAMFLIHVLGYAADMKAYRNFGDANNLLVLEDCCESLGAFSHGKHVGTHGYGGTFSHFFSHHLTTMEGGSIVTDDDKLADDLRSLRAHGWIRDRSDKTELTRAHSNLDPRFLFVMPGYNVRPLEIEAAIGLVQLKKLPLFLEQRERIVRDFHELLKQIPWLRIIGSETLNTKSADPKTRTHSWMNIPLVLEQDAPLSLNQVKSLFEEQGVDTRPIITGNLLHHPAMKSIEHRRSKDFSTADSILGRGFMIGCHPGLADSTGIVFEKLVRELKRL